MKEKVLTTAEIELLQGIIKHYSQDISNEETINKVWQNIPSETLFQVGEVHYLSKDKILTFLQKERPFKESIVMMIYDEYQKSLKNLGVEPRALPQKEEVYKISEKQDDKEAVNSQAGTTEDASELPDSIVDLEPERVSALSGAKTADTSPTQIDSETTTPPPVTHEINDLEARREPPFVDTTISQKTDDTQEEIEVKEPPEVSTKPYLLKNGKVGKEYSETLDFSRIHSTGEISHYTIDGLDKIGLELDEDAGEIKGVPKMAGDPGENFELVLTLRYQLAEGHIEKRELSIKILPDPRSLWKEIEPAEELGDRKAHTYSDFKKIGKDKKGKPRFIVAASKRGRAHAHKGTFRDDHTQIEYLKDLGWSIITVADGAGSANLSRVGSEIACKTAVNFIKEKLDHQNDDLYAKIKAAKNNKENNAEDHDLKKLLYLIVATAGFQARKAIQEEKERRQESIGQFHTTLVIGIHKEFEFGNFFAGFWIGDGALALYDKDAKKIELLGLPDGGEYSGQTKFITEEKNWTEDAKPFDRVRYRICNDFTAFFAMSDGITDPKFPTESNLGKIKNWDMLWDELEDEVFDPENNVEQKLLDWLDFWAEGEHDDRTIVILF